MGKTLVAAALALRTALLEAPALVLILTPSERQSSEFVRRIKELHETLRQPLHMAGSVQSLFEKQVAFLMEIDALYCDVIVQRWENFTRCKAERKPAASS